MRCNNTKVTELDGEKLLPIEDFPGYFISNFGRVKSLPKSNRLYSTILTTNIGSHGYHTVLLHKKGKFKRFNLHRLIATAFIPNPKKLLQVNHINSIKTDNSIENLEWCTHQENLSHASRMGKMQHGENRHNNALTEKEVLEIFNSSIAQRPISKIYNVHQGTIAKIRTGQNWSYLTGKVYGH